MSVSFWVHMIATILFIPFLFLPVMVRQWAARAAEGPFASMKMWKGLFHLAHLALVLSLVSGLFLNYSFTSSWFWVVLVVFLALGAVLGIAAKYLRLTVEGMEQKNQSSDSFAKLQRFSMILAFIILLMIVLMSARW